MISGGGATTCTTICKDCLKPLAYGKSGWYHVAPYMALTRKWDDWIDGAMLLPCWSHPKPIPGEAS